MVLKLGCGNGIWSPFDGRGWPGFGPIQNPLPHTPSSVGRAGLPPGRGVRFNTGEMLDANEVERSPEDSVLESLSNAALLDAVRRLNPQQQECVTLRFLQGLSVAETARVMGKNEGAIKTLQYRAVRTLARLLPDDAR